MRVPGYEAPVVGTCPECGGPVHCNWRSKLGLSEYYCNKCGNVTNYLPRTKVPDDSITKDFEEVIKALFDSGMDTLKISVVSQLVMKRTHTTKVSTRHMPTGKYRFDFHSGTITQKYKEQS
jgi:hypothetical protein